MPGCRDEGGAEPGTARGALWVGGALLLAATAGLAGMSSRFGEAVATAERPIVGMVALLLLAWLGYGLGWRGLRGLSGRRALLAIIAVGLVARGLLLASTPMQEIDYYRYIWDGMVGRAGIHPYEAAPEALWAEEVEPRDDRYLDAVAIQSRIDYADIKTIYPPAAQVVFRLNAALWGWSPLGPRWTFLAADLALMAVLLLGLRAARLQSHWILLYAWNPLVLKEITNAMHLDVVAALALGVFAWAVLRGRPVLAAAALWAATFVKLTPAVLGPLWLIWAWRSGRRRGAIGGLVVGLGLSALSLAWMLHGVDDPLAGLRAFNRDWEVNDLLFGLGRRALQAVTSGSAVAARAQLKVVYAAAILVALILVGRRVRDGQSLLRGSLILLLAVWCLGPLGNPWYLCWVLPFLVLLRAWPVALLMAGSSLYYIDFILLDSGAPAAAFIALQAGACLPFYASLGWGLRRAPRPAADMESPPH